MESNITNSNLNVYISILKDILGAGKTVTIKCIGASMEPTLIDGLSYQLYPKKKGEQLKIGDIVFVSINSNINFVHRIVAIYNNYFITKGDNNMREDIPCTYEEIYGVLYDNN